MKKTILTGAALLAALSASAEKLAFLGTTDKNPLEYALNETITFTVTLVDKDNGNAAVTGRELKWTLSGDDSSLDDSGTATSDTPLVVTTASSLPGFVRLKVQVKDNGNWLDDKDNVFDGNYNTYFASYDRSGTWVGLDLGQKHVITRIGCSPRIDHGQRVELAMIEGANEADFSDALPIAIIKNRGENRKMQYVEAQCSRGFRYVRYVGPNDVRCNLSELEFYGIPDDLRAQAIRQFKLGCTVHYPRATAKKDPDLLSIVEQFEEHYR